MVRRQFVAFKRKNRKNASRSNVNNVALSESEYQDIVDRRLPRITESNYTSKGFEYCWYTKSTDEKGIDIWTYKTYEWLECLGLQKLLLLSPTGRTRTVIVAWLIHKVEHLTLNDVDADTQLFFSQMIDPNTSCNRQFSKLVKSKGVWNGNCEQDMWKVITYSGNVPLDLSEPTLVNILTEKGAIPIPLQRLCPLSVYHILSNPLKYPLHTNWIHSSALNTPFHASLLEIPMQTVVASFPSSTLYILNYFEYDDFVPFPYPRAQTWGNVKPTFNDKIDNCFLLMNTLTQDESWKALEINLGLEGQFTHLISIKCDLDTIMKGSSLTYSGKTLNEQEYLQRVSCLIGKSALSLPELPKELCQMEEVENEIEITDVVPDCDPSKIIRMDEKKQADFPAHIDILKNERAISCPIESCNCFRSTMASIVQHMNKNHKSSREKCAICKKKFFPQFNILANHYIRHGDGNYKRRCKECKNTYYDKRGLNRHFKSSGHSGEMRQWEFNSWYWSNESTTNIDEINDSDV